MRTTGMRHGAADGDRFAARNIKREAEMADVGLAGAYRAEPSNADDCFACGMIHSSGAGVAIDLVQAHKWFNIAAMRGHRDAARLRREIAEQMSDTEIGSAQRAARDWLRAHPQPSVAPPQQALIAARQIASRRLDSRGLLPLVVARCWRPARLAIARRVGHIRATRRRGRVAEGGGLLNRYTLVKAYRGFESLRLRQPILTM